MIETIQKIRESPAGSFSFIFGVMFLAGWVIHYATKFATRITTKHESITDRMSRTESFIDEIRKDIAFIKGSFDAVMSVKDPTTKRKSPLSLTDFGKSIAESNNLGEIVNTNWVKISAALKESKAKNPYDIQQFCIEDTFVTPERFFSDKDLGKLKIIAFKSGLPLL
jgi:hypothetical protein